MTFVIIENGRQHRKFKWAAENLGMEWTGRLPQNTAKTTQNYHFTSKNGATSTRVRFGGVWVRGNR